MTRTANATFAIKSWDEKPFGETSGAAKLTHASVVKTYHGDIEGEGTLEYLMAYAHDGTATFTGFERVVGTVGGRHGHFVFQHAGTFKDGVATSTWTVVPGSGGGGLEGLSGTVHSALGHGKDYPVEFRYTVAP